MLTERRWKILFWMTLAVVVVLSARLVKADIRMNLMTRLDVKIHDSSNLMLDSTSKIAILDEVGQEFGRRLLFVKRDDITLIKDSADYAAPSDFAGAIRGAYIRDGYDLTFLTVVNFEDMNHVPDADGLVAYIYVAADGRVGLYEIPVAPSSLVMSYYAYPAALSGDSTEWDIPDGLEGAALDLAAAKCWMTADLRPDMAQMYYQRYLEVMARETKTVIEETQK